MIPTELLALKNKFSGEKAIVVACGPSIEHWEKIASQNRDHKIVAVKQSIFRTKDKTDIHFYNSYNVSNYDLYKLNHKYLTIFQDDLMSPKQFNRYDIRCFINKDPKNPYKDCIGLTQDYSRFLVSKSGFLRPWGLGFYLKAFYIF